MIKENVHKILAEIPKGVELVAACKGRTPEEILEAIEGGVQIVGQNYVQEAEKAYAVIGSRAKWHFIGTLQKNKIRKILKMFDMIEALDSLDIAQFLDRICEETHKTMPVLVEINSAREENKSGIFPEDAEDFIENLAIFKNIKVMGIMTMGPLCENSEDIRKYFNQTKSLFEAVKKLNLEHVDMKYLSMGMSDSYKVAIEEGANIVRIGTKIFGMR